MLANKRSTFFLLLLKAASLYQRRASGDSGLLLDPKMTPPSEAKPAVGRGSGGVREHVSGGCVLVETPLTLNPPSTHTYTHTFRMVVIGSSLFPVVLHGEEGGGRYRHSPSHH